MRRADRRLHPEAAGHGITKNRPPEIVHSDGRFAFRTKKKSILIAQDVLDDSGDGIRTNDTSGTKQAAPAPGKLITQQKYEAPLQMPAFANKTIC